MLSIYQSIARDSRSYQYKKQIDKKLKESEAKKKRKTLKESTNINVTPDGSVNVNIDNTVAPVPEVIEPVEEVSEVVEEPIEEAGAEVNLGAKVDVPDDLASAAGMALLASEDVKEGCSKEDKESEDGEKTITEEETKESEEVTESEEEVGRDVIEDIVAKISAEDEELANKVREILSKEPEEVEEVSEEIVEEIPEEPLEECEITSFTISRVAPKSNVYMLEAQTKDGLRYITGKNFNKETKILDEAEISDNKAQASDRFRKLMKGE